HVLVKFTPARANENIKRSFDLLRAEELALLLMQQHGLSEPQTALIAAGNGQLFIEVVRFDRAGENGRLSMVSLEAVQAEFIGNPHHWPAALQQLVQ
ncbi:transcriptional regulator, partial [Erwinia amylovora]|nr:transcriptional regulator [Erwinia amylovora]